MKRKEHSKQRQKHVQRTNMNYNWINHSWYGSYSVSDGKESAYNAGDPGLIAESGRSPGEENGNPLQNSCLENSMDRGVSQAIVHGVTRSKIRLSN